MPETDLNLEQIVESMINDPSVSEEEIASVIEEPDNGDQSDNGEDQSSNGEKITKERGEYGGKKGVWVHTDIAKGVDYVSSEPSTDQVTTRTSEFIADEDMIGEYDEPSVLHPSEVDIDGGTINLN